MNNGNAELFGIAILGVVFIIMFVRVVRQVKEGKIKITENIHRKMQAPQTKPREQQIAVKEEIQNEELFKLGQKVGSMTLKKTVDNVKDHVTDKNKKNLLKRRFHEKKRLVAETSKHHADLTRDMKKGTQDEVLEEFFAGISLDMKAIQFPEAKEITLEQLKILKAKTK